MTINEIKVGPLRMISFPHGPVYCGCTVRNAKVDGNRASVGRSFSLLDLSLSDSMFGIAREV